MKRTFAEAEAENTELKQQRDGMRQRKAALTAELERKRQQRQQGQQQEQQQEQQQQQQQQQEEEQQGDIVDEQEGQEGLREEQPQPAATALAEGGAASPASSSQDLVQDVGGEQQQQQQQQQAGAAAAVAAPAGEGEGLHHQHPLVQQVLQAAAGAQQAAAASDAAVAAQAIGLLEAFASTDANGHTLLSAQQWQDLVCLTAVICWLAQVSQASSACCKLSLGAADMRDDCCLSVGHKYSTLARKCSLCLDAGERADAAVRAGRGLPVADCAETPPARRGRVRCAGVGIWAKWHVFPALTRMSVMGLAPQSDSQKRVA